MQVQWQQAAAGGRLRWRIWQQAPPLAAAELTCRSSWRSLQVSREGWQRAEGEGPVKDWRFASRSSGSTCMGDRSGSPVLSGAAPSRLDTLAGGGPLPPPPPPLPGAAIAITAAVPLRAFDADTCVRSVLVQLGKLHREAIREAAATGVQNPDASREEGRRRDLCVAISRRFTTQPSVRLGLPSRPWFAAPATDAPAVGRQVLLSATGERVIGPR